MIALPASASPVGTTVSITVLDGSLSVSASDNSPSIAVPSDAGGLDTQAQIVSTSLGAVRVTDGRSAGHGWVASVVCTAFTRPAGSVIASSAVGYTAGTITSEGTGRYAANDPAALGGIAAAVTATGITADDSATWYPTITVDIPAGTTAGIYAATITHSVL